MQSAKCSIWHFQVVAAIMAQILFSSELFVCVPPSAFSNVSKETGYISVLKWKDIDALYKCM